MPTAQLTRKPRPIQAETTPAPLLPTPLLPRPDLEAPAERGRLGDWIALLIWVGCVGLMAAMVLADTLFGFWHSLWGS